MKTDVEGKHLSVELLLMLIVTNSEHLASILGSATDSLGGLGQVLSALSIHLFYFQANKSFPFFSICFLSWPSRAMRNFKEDK